MKIFSWNIWSNNNNQAQNLENFLRKFDPDVLCLQEVNLQALSWIQSQTMYNNIFAVDYYSKKKKENAEHYLVILSKYNIQNNQNENKFSVRHITRGSIWETINRWIESMEFQYADIYFPNEKFRVFNVHLEVASGPKVRFQQFKETINKFDKQKTNIICGDFNIYGSPVINILIGWLLGYKPSEIFINERKIFERIFKQYNLINPFYGKTTFPMFRLQLDHILIPIQKKILKQEVINDRFGSDHCPIMLVF